MTKEELAERMDRRFYGEEITYEEEKEVKESGLIVLFGFSDDTLEVRGAINDELPAYEETEFMIAIPGDKIPVNHEGSICYLDVNHLQVVEWDNGFKETENKFKVNFCSSGSYSWIIETDLPHSTFKITDEGEVYCVGIIIDVKDLVKSTKPLDLIAAERERQIVEEGHSFNNDDQWINGELAEAAATYASNFSSISCWPWDKERYKPSPDNRIRQLVKAGALIVAEIERLQRVYHCCRCDWSGSKSECNLSTTVFGPTEKRDVVSLTCPFCDYDVYHD